MSFFIGCITTIPAVQLFCLYTAVAITFTFIYQLTFFLGLLVLYARLEDNAKHSITFGKTVSSSHRGLFVKKNNISTLFLRSRAVLYTPVQARLTRL